MSNIIQFGERVAGYDIPVLNEREIRAAAGILFLATFTSLMLILFKNNFVPIKYVVTIFLTDLLIRVSINPRFAPSLIIGRWMVRNQVPEYVGAAQKRFAWLIGILLSGTLFTFLVVVNAYSPITGIGCLICLIFLFFETAFGICLGCKVYSLFYKKKARHCPGETCDRKAKQDIQKISLGQWLVVFVFIAYIFLIGSIGNPYFSKQPYNLFRIVNAAQPK